MQENKATITGSRAKIFYSPREVLTAAWKSSATRAKLFCGPREETGSKWRFAHWDSVSRRTQRKFARRFCILAQKWTVSREDSWICTKLYGQQTQEMTKKVQQEARKIDFFLAHGGRQKCVCGMWASCFTHTSTRSLYEGSSRYEHCIVHPKIHLQTDLLLSI